MGKWPLEALLHSSNIIEVVSFSRRLFPFKCAVVAKERERERRKQTEQKHKKNTVPSVNSNRDV